MQPPGHPGCNTSSRWGCSVANIRAASETTLRAAGPVMTVSCAQRLEETPVDAAYMQACVENMRELAVYLSEKWALVLHPIEVGTIRYDWDVQFGCVDFLLGNGRGGGICPVYGEASIPLSWREAAPGIK